MIVTNELNFWIRAILFVIWFVISSVLGLVVAVFRFKNVRNNAVFGRIFGHVARAILGIRVHLEGLEYATSARPCIFVLNHQSAADMATFSPIFPTGTVLIGKKQLRYIPIWGLMYEAFGNILIDRKNRANSVAGLREAVEALKQHGLSIMIFPEGTRNAEFPGLLPFKKGAFHMAIEAQVPIAPWVSATIKPFVDFKARRIRGGDFWVRVLPPIPTAGLGPSDVPELLTRTQDAMLAALLELNAKSRPNR